MKNNSYTLGENVLEAKGAKIAACYNGSEINKSEIGYAFTNSNPSPTAIQFPKKGELLIKMISDKKNSLQEKYDFLKVREGILKEKLIELGITFRERVNDDDTTWGEPVWNYDQTDDATKKIIYEYQDLGYPCRRLREEIKTCQLLIDNLDAKKSYSLSISQLSSLQKAMNFDIEKAETAVEKAEVDNVVVVEEKDDLKKALEVIGL